MVWEYVTQSVINYNRISKKFIKRQNLKHGMPLILAARYNFENNKDMDETHQEPKPVWFIIITIIVSNVIDTLHNISTLYHFRSLRF